ncbi:MAG: hypothetical protein LUD14_00070, partial [Clostridiales bacterium]|nr:hypothetical protein [Clostridiales bacterium]
FRIGVRAGSQYEYYYAEPVNLFTRKAFEWNNDKYAESLFASVDYIINDGLFAYEPYKIVR